MKIKIDAWTKLLRNTPNEGGGGGGPSPEPPAPSPDLISGSGEEPKGESTLPGGSEPKPAAEPPVPLTSADITLPEGFEVAEEDMTSFLEILNDSALTPSERGSKLVSLQAAVIERLSGAAMEQSAKAWGDMQEAWRAEATKLPDIGGDKLPETLAQIKKGLTAVGAGEEFFKALTFTGAGNNPHVIQVMHKLVQPYLEKPPVGGDPTRAPLTQAEKMFGKKGD